LDKQGEIAMRHERILGAAAPLLLGAALLAGASASAQAACGLRSADNKIKRVVHIQFDNVHLRRDNPNVPSSPATGQGKDCSQPPACVSQTPGFAWNHGDVQKDITRTWMGMVGPGVQRLGRHDRVFSDHTDLRPTRIALTGLKDDYIHDGRVLIELLDDRALPRSLRGSENFLELAQAYKQLNAPLGSVGLNSLRLANMSILGDDAGYGKFLATIAEITSRRDALAGEIKAALDGAAFGNQPIKEQQQDQLVRRARAMIERVADLAGGDQDHDRDNDHH
jgi:hypothetical protein